MDRRSVLKTVSILVGGAMSAGTVATIMSGCQANTSDDWLPMILNNQQVETLAEIVDIIIPATDTPGAKELMVHRVIDEAIAKNFNEKEQTKIINGINTINEECEKKYKKSFIAASEQERTAILESIDEASYATIMARKSDPSKEMHYFYNIKNLTMSGYFLTEIGHTKVLQHVAIPGRNEACIPIEKAGNGKTWAQG